MSVYTPAILGEMRDQAPLDLVKAKAIAEKHGLSYRSVIAKAKTEKIEYVKLAPAAKKPKGVTKADLSASIAEAMGTDADSLSGLDKAPFAVLQKVLAAFTAASVEDTAE